MVKLVHLVFIGFQWWSLFREESTGSYPFYGYISSGWSPRVKLWVGHLESQELVCQRRRIARVVSLDPNDSAVCNVFSVMFQCPPMLSPLFATNKCCTNSDSRIQKSSMVNAISYRRSEDQRIAQRGAQSSCLHGSLPNVTFNSAHNN